MSDPVSDVDDLRSRVDAVAWYHSIDLGNGITTPGLSVNSMLSGDRLPDFRGKTVLDIGAWDGYYSFLAERGGAARVVALDHYAWGVDVPARDKYWAECAAKGILPDHALDLTEFYDPDLPGRRGFDLAREALNSKVEAVVADFMTVDLDALGTFDIVLYLGVLYHIREPLHALDRVRAVTREMAVVETEAVHIEGLENASLALFHAGGELGFDYGNWYVPNLRALNGWCLAADFSRVETKVGPHGIEGSGGAEARNGSMPATPSAAARLRTVGARLRHLGEPRPAPASRNYRATVHAFV